MTLTCAILEEAIDQLGQATLAPTDCWFYSSKLQRFLLVNKDHVIGPISLERWRCFKYPKVIRIEDLT